MVKLKEVLMEALNAVEEAAIPEDLRAIAFEKAIDLAAASRGLVAPGGPQHPEPAPAPPAGEPADQSDVLAQITAGLKVERSLVENVYGADGTELTLTVPFKKLSSAKSTAAQEIALLVAAGRQKGGLDQSGWTNAEIIVDTCKHYDKYDQANFAKSLKALDAKLQIKGAGSTAQVKVKHPGFDAAADLINSMGKP